MPNGIYPVPKFHSPSRSGPGARVPLRLRMRTRLRRHRLDEALAAGADPAAAPELALRARQLESRTVRSQSATAIVELLGEAHAPYLGPFGTAARERNARIREHADSLRALVDRLRDDDPITAPGAAMAARLVNDRSGPLYREGVVSLGSAALAVRFALDRSGSSKEDLARAA